MPTYTFIDTKKKAIVEVDLKMSEYDKFKKKNPHLERYHTTAPAVTFNGRTFRSLDAKTDNTWKEVLSKIAEKNPASPLAESYRKKSVKEVKTREVLNKYQKKLRDRQK